MLRHFVAFGTGFAKPSGAMKLHISQTKRAMADAAANDGADAIKRAISAKGSATIVVATGASQFEMLERLTSDPDIAWDKVTGFHLDEYVGLPISHGASFRLYLWQRFVSKLRLPMRAFHFINAEVQPDLECRRLAALIRREAIDVMFCGIGENGHLAFNDPPANFQTDEPYIVVELDEACRAQQMGEGWFPDADAVPRTAISMSIRQMLKSKQIVCTVPDARKAKAVQGAVEGPVTNEVPASILQTHAATTIYVDAPAASLLKKV